MLALNKKKNLSYKNKNHCYIFSFFLIVICRRKILGFYIINVHVLHLLLPDNPTLFVAKGRDFFWENFHQITENRWQNSSSFNKVNKIIKNFKSILIFYLCFLLCLKFFFIIDLNKCLFGTLEYSYIFMIKYLKCFFTGYGK